MCLCIDAGITCRALQVHRLAFARRNSQTAQLTTGMHACICVYATVMHVRIRSCAPRYKSAADCLRAAEDDQGPHSQIPSVATMKPHVSEQIFPGSTPQSNPRGPATREPCGCGQGLQRQQLFGAIHLHALSIHVRCAQLYVHVHACMHILACVSVCGRGYIEYLRLYEERVRTITHILEPIRRVRFR